MADGEGISAITDADVERFLFDAPGYESGAPKIKVPGLPDSDRVIYHKDGLYEMWDQYCIGPDGWSDGVTTVLHEGIPVWRGHYGGCYPEHVLVFLKLALLKTKKLREFIGGRGPRFYRNYQGTLVYVNTPEPGSTFSRYRGK